jgi:hypothetical protein
VRFFDACQSLIETLVAEGQAAVIDAQLMQDGGIQVIDVYRVVLETGRPLADSEVAESEVAPAISPSAAIESSSTQP